MENVQEVSPDQLAEALQSNSPQLVLVDVRTFCEYNAAHIASSVNLWTSKIRKKKLQQGSASVADYLASVCGRGLVLADATVAVYDQSSCLPPAPDTFLHVVLERLVPLCHRTVLLRGGFLQFAGLHPSFTSSTSPPVPSLSSLSQPCLPVSNVGPTKVLPFLFLGSEHDANDRQMLSVSQALQEILYDFNGA